VNADRFLDFVERHFGKIWIAYVAVVLAFWIVVIFVAAHFIAKWW